ncbi:MAG: translation initiation factor IF-2 [Tepidisphaeraceae bacterium]
MAKGIRVNLLAKELGVESKLILAKLREEGLGDQAPNHMSTLSMGLAESVREWFGGQGGGGGGTAVETAAPVETKKKTRPPAKKDETYAPPEEPPRPHVAKTVEHALASPVAPPVVVAEKPAVTERPVADRSVVERPAPERPVVERAIPTPTPPVAPPPAPAPAVIPAPASAAPVPNPPAHVHEPLVARETPPAPPAPPVAPPVTMRPTVTIANRQPHPPAPPVEARTPVTPAPQLRTPEPAKISGPRIVRIEKEETIDTRGPRRPLAPGSSGNAPPAFSPPAARGGRGVKIGDEEESEEQRKKNAAKKGNSNSTRRRGVDGRRGEAMEKLREFTHADLLERQERLNAAASYAAGVNQHLNKTQNRGQHATARTIVQKGEPVEIEEPITVKALSAALGVKSNDIIKRLMKQNVMATINQSLDADTAGTIALELGIELRITQRASLEDQFVNEIIQRAVEAKNLVPRPPVVTILGHVDHGKTSLLDKIRNAHVAAGEAGGITQHTAAWQVQIGTGENIKRVTFIDTPGHQAFTSMRARGANMTDVVVLVVGATEGVQPQTIESINHARAAKAPIVVAMNKIDRPDANPDMVLGQLAKEGLNPVEWGGDVEVLRTSALTGQGIPELIEVLDLQSQLMELKTDPTVPARGIVIESRVDEGLGTVATVLVQDGTLRVGDIALAGAGYGRIRSLLNDRGEPIQEATASTPVMVSGLGVPPNAGDRFFVVEDMDRARSIAEERSSQTRQNFLAGQSRVTADNLLATMRAGAIRTINLIIKADVQGSVETLAKTVTDSNTEEVRVKVIHCGVGPINESDVELAMATRASFDDPKKDKVAVIGFHVVPDDSARALAEQNRIDVKLYRVIYEIFDDLKKALSGMLAPEVREKLHGHAEIRQVFKVSKVGNIAGCMVTDGHIQRGSRIRLIRNGTVITEDLSLETLRRVKDDVKEVKAGFECGIKIAGYDDIKVGDVLEAYVREEFERTL